MSYWYILVERVQELDSFNASLNHEHHDVSFTAIADERDVIVFISHDIIRQTIGLCSLS